MDRTRLLVVPLETLTLANRALALIEARNRGRLCAEHAGGPEELEDAPADLYVRMVVEPALENDEAANDALAAWRRLRTNEGALLRDPRVQAFFFGWHERATEILAHIANPESEQGADFRARWFLDSLKGVGLEREDGG